MRVLHVIPSLSPRTGGPAGVVLEGAAALARAGVETEVWATDMDAPASAGDRARITAASIVAEGVTVRVFEHKRPARLAFAPALYRALAEEVRRFDAVHVHSLFLFPQFAAYRAARAAGVPYAVSPRGALDPYLRTRNRAVKALADAAWQRNMLRDAARLHLTSEAEAQQVRDIASGVRRAVIANGVDCARYELAHYERTDGQAFRREHLGGFSGPLVVFMGRLSRKKGIDVLVRALAIARARVPGARLAIVGPDDERLSQRIRDLADSLGVADAVTLTGMLTGDAKLEALAAADAWALPSRGENFGNAVVEATAAGRAVVISPAVGIAREAQEAGAAAVAERTPEGFAAAIVDALEDDAGRAELGRRAQSFARRYDWSAIAPQMAEMYEQMARAA